MRTLRPAIVVFGGLTLLTGIVYPLAVTGIAQLIFPHQANGSVVENNGAIVGSALIGQRFADAKYFWSRPSASATPYDASVSGGSNAGPLNPALADAVKQRVAALRAAHPDQAGSVPVDLVTASASGLDPDLSPAAAYYQSARVAGARGLTQTEVNTLIAHQIKPRLLGVLGEPVVNVLQLNLALDALAKPRRP